MIILKITTKKLYRKSKKIGDYFVYFNGYFEKELNKKISLKFKSRSIGFLDKDKKLIEISRCVENGLPLYYFLRHNEIVI